MDNAIVNQHIRRDDHGFVDECPRAVGRDIDPPPGFHVMAEAVVQHGRVADRIVGIVVVVVVEGGAVVVLRGRVGCQGDVQSGGGGVVEGKEGRVLIWVLNVGSPAHVVESDEKGHVEDVAGGRGVDYRRERVLEEVDDATAKWDVLPPR